MSVYENDIDSPEILDRAGKYLTFRLDSEEYGLEILKVREIIGLMNITSVPRAPEYIRGVINLRGTIIPVLDLKLKFEMGRTERTEETCIVVVEVSLADEAALMGVMVDAVSEVINITADEIEETPSFGAGVDTRFILGMAKVKNSVKILLDINQVLSTGDLKTLQGLDKVETGENKAAEEEVETVREKN